MESESPVETTERKLVKESREELMESESTVAKRARLMSEDESDANGSTNRRNKQIYVRIRTLYGHTWLVSDYKLNFDGQNSLEEAKDMLESMPMGIKIMSTCSNAVWKSKIFFIGGKISSKIDERIYSNKVYAFDVHTKLWDGDDCYPCMQSARAHATAEVAADRLFVFGTGRQGELEEGQFAEYMDLSSDKSKGVSEWKYIPNPPNKLFSAPFIRSVAAAVCEFKSYLIFWVYPFGGFYMLDYVSLEWLPREFFSLPQPWEDIPFDFYWNDRVVVLLGAIFWHICGVIYAYDLTLGESKVQNVQRLCSIDNRFLRLSNPYRPTYLVAPSEGTLCLIWAHSKYFCQTFSVERSEGRLYVQKCPTPGYFTTPPEGNFQNIHDVLVV